MNTLGKRSAVRYPSPCGERLGPFTGFCSVFYALANKYHDKIGLALVRFDESNPFLHKYILNVNTKLEIDNADVSIMINKERNLKELIISYKTIYLNTFTIFVIDLSTKDFYTVFRHYSA